MGEEHPNKGKNLKDIIMSSSGSCDAPSESGGEEGGSLKRQEQLEPSGHDDQHYDKDKMKEQTTLVNMVPELTLVMEEDRKDSQAMGESRELVVDRVVSTEWTQTMCCE